MEKEYIVRMTFVAEFGCGGDNEQDAIAVAQSAAEEMYGTDIFEGSEFEIVREDQ